MKQFIETLHFCGLEGKDKCFCLANGHIGQCGVLLDFDKFNTSCKWSILEDDGWPSLECETDESTSTTQQNGMTLPSWKEKVDCSLLNSRIYRLAIWLPWPSINSWVRSWMKQIVEVKLMIEFNCLESILTLRRCIKLGCIKLHVKLYNY